MLAVRYAVSGSDPMDVLDVTKRDFRCHLSVLIRRELGPPHELAVFGSEGQCLDLKSQCLDLKGQSLYISFRYNGEYGDLTVSLGI